MPFKLRPRRRYYAELRPGDSFWTSYAGVRADDQAEPETHVTVVADTVATANRLVRLRRDDGSECLVELRTLSFHGRDMYIDPPSA